MTEAQGFWSVDLHEGAPSFFVCMACLNEVFWAKVPMPACPTCQEVSTYEAFTLDSIQDWGTEELIRKAQTASEEIPTLSPTEETTPAIVSTTSEDLSSKQP
ncbi:MAG: hypothetical protein GKS05_00820 [Nitrospirales bacterium]|nr:hypothetical protein [Nitrospirales bacterium]